jgi:hypothetical protein
VAKVKPTLVEKEALVPVGNGLKSRFRNRD